MAMIEVQIGGGNHVESRQGTLRSARKFNTPPLGAGLASKRCDIKKSAGAMQPWHVPGDSPEHSSLVFSENPLQTHFGDITLMATGRPE